MTGVQTCALPICPASRRCGSARWFGRSLARILRGRYWQVKKGFELALCQKSRSRRIPMALTDLHPHPSNKLDLRLTLTSTGFRALIVLPFTCSLTTDSFEALARQLRICARSRSHAYPDRMNKSLFKNTLQLMSYFLILYKETHKIGPFSPPNSHALKTLPVSTYESRLWRENIAKPMILIDRW